MVVAHPVRFTAFQRPRLRYCVHTIPPFVRIWNPMNPTRTQTLYLGIPGGLFSCSVPINNYHAFVVSLRTTCLIFCLSMYRMPHLLFFVRTTCLICCHSTYRMPHLLSLRTTCLICCLSTYHKPQLLSLYVPHAWPLPVFDFRPHICCTINVLYSSRNSPCSVHFFYYLPLKHPQFT